MVVDIGGGTTDIAVLSLNGIATSSSIKVAGDTFDEAVAAYMRKHYGMLIGLNTAEEVKITIGCVYPRPQELSMLVKGRDAKTGLPNEVTISSTEMLDAFKRPARQIVDEVLARCTDQAQQYRDGNKKVIGFLVGQCMKAAKGSGNPKLFNQLLAQKLS